MTTHCNACGAPIPTSVLRATCASCGAGLIIGMTTEQELEALGELRAAIAKREGTELDDFLRGAYVPHTWKAATKAFAEAIQGVSDESSSSRAFLSRAEAIYSSASLNHLSDPAMLNAAPIMKERLESARQVAYKSDIALKSMNAMNTNLLVVVYIAMPFILLAAATILVPMVWFIIQS